MTVKLLIVSGQVSNYFGEGFYHPTFQEKSPMVNILPKLRVTFIINEKLNPIYEKSIIIGLIVLVIESLLVIIEELLVLNTL